MNQPNLLDKARGNIDFLLSYPSLPLIEGVRTYSLCPCRLQVAPPTPVGSAGRGAADGRWCGRKFFVQTQPDEPWQLHCFSEVNVTMTPNLNVHLRTHHQCQVSTNLSYLYKARERSAACQSPERGGLLRPLRWPEIRDFGGAGYAPYAKPGNPPGEKRSSHRTEGPAESRGPGF